MDINKLDPTSLQFTEEEMNALAKVMVIAKQVREDHTLFDLVMKHVEKSVVKLNNLDDLKKHRNTFGVNPQKMSKEI